MFTSMDLDEKVFQQAWQLTGLRTKKAVMEALRWLDLTARRCSPPADRGAVRPASGAAGAVRVGAALVAALRKGTHKGRPYSRSTTIEKPTPPAAQTVTSPRF